MFLIPRDIIGRLETDVTVEPLFNMGPLNSWDILSIASHIYNENSHIKVENHCWFSSTGLVLVLAGSCLASCWPLLGPGPASV